MTTLVFAKPLKQLQMQLAQILQSVHLSKKKKVCPLLMKGVAYVQVENGPENPFSQNLTKGNPSPCGGGPIQMEHARLPSPITPEMIKFPSKEGGLLPPLPPPGQTTSFVVVEKTKKSPRSSFPRKTTSKAGWTWLPNTGRPFASIGQPRRSNGAGQ